MSTAKKPSASILALDDIDKMKERAAQNNMFLYIKVCVCVCRVCVCRVCVCACVSLAGVYVCVATLFIVFGFKFQKPRMI